MDIMRLLNAYADRRMARIFLIGMISGFPWVLIGSALSLWLQETGSTRSAVGFAGLIFGVYAVNFLWAPLVDRLPLPVLSKNLGRRKAWILLCQSVIIVGLVLWSLLDPAYGLVAVIATGLGIACASATQDIAIDAMRIEQVGEGEHAAMAAGAAMAVMGWWTGFKIGGLVLLAIADFFEGAGFANYWNLTFLVMAVPVAVMGLLAMFIPEMQASEKNKTKSQSGLMEWFKDAVIAPFTAFFAKNGIAIALGVLGFIFLFKIGEAFVGRMSVVFYREMGFTKTDIGIFSKGIGWLTTIGFTLIGGWIAMRSGSVRALFIAGIAMASTNLLFALMAWTGKSKLLFAIAVAVDDFAAAFATVAFVAFISLMVDRRYTATQYALLNSLGTAGRTLLAASSGALVDVLDGDWGVFFIITTLMVIPSLILLAWLAPRLGLGRGG